MLTGKAKKDFTEVYNMSDFNSYNPLCQLATIVDFFDKSGCGIIIEIKIIQPSWWGYSIL